MDDQSIGNLRQLLVLFQQIWIEREAFRIKHNIEAAGETASWGKVLQGARTLSQDIFQPALSDVDAGTPPPLVLEGLLKRLIAYDKPPVRDQ
jgi:hypothetical protein